jgi:hypothetical protein
MAVMRWGFLRGLLKRECGAGAKTPRTHYHLVYSKALIWYIPNTPFSIYQMGKESAVSGRRECVVRPKTPWCPAKESAVLFQRECSVFAVALHCRQRDTALPATWHCSVFSVRARPKKTDFTLKQQRDCEHVINRSGYYYALILCLLQVINLYLWPNECY